MAGRPRVWEPWAVTSKCGTAAMSVSNRCTTLHDQHQCFVTYAGGAVTLYSARYKQLQVTNLQNKTQ